MEFHHISSILYELMRVKEDRLSMKWEDERCQFVRHIETLTETNEMLLAEQAKQNDSYNNLLGTIASFNPISSSGVSPYETTAKNRFRQANTANGASKRPRPLNDDENDFISINRNKQLKKGSIDNFFASANSVPVSKFTTKKPKHKNTLSISTKAAEVANLVDPNDNEWWNIPTVGTTNINKAAVVSAGGQKAAWNSGLDINTQMLGPSGNPECLAASANADTSNGIHGRESVEQVDYKGKKVIAEVDDDDDDVTVDGDTPAAAAKISALSNIVIAADDAHRMQIAAAEDADPDFFDADITQAQDCSQTTCGSTPGNNLLSYNNSNSNNVKATSISSHSSGSSAVPVYWNRQQVAPVLPSMQSQSQMSQSQLLSQEFNVSVRKGTDFALAHQEEDNDVTDNPYFPALGDNISFLLRPSSAASSDNKSNRRSTGSSREEIIDLSDSPQKDPLRSKPRRTSGNVTFGNLDFEADDQQAKQQAGRPSERNATMGPPEQQQKHAQEPPLMQGSAALFSPKSGTRGKREKGRPSLDKSDASLLLLAACHGASPERIPSSASSSSSSSGLSSVSHRFAQPEPRRDRDGVNRLLSTVLPPSASTSVKSARAVDMGADNPAFSTRHGSAGATEPFVVDVDADADACEDEEDEDRSMYDVSAITGLLAGDRGRPQQRPHADTAETNIFARECAKIAGTGSKSSTRTAVPEKENIRNRNTTSITSADAGAGAGAGAGVAASTSSSSARMGKPVGGVSSGSTRVGNGIDWRSDQTAPTRANCSNVYSKGNGTVRTIQAEGAVATSSNSKSKCIESVRSKVQRAALPGYTCEECAKFYETMQQQGIYNLDDSQLKREILQACSRHKARWTPPSTPEGFWNLTLETPDDWK